MKTATWGMPGLRWDDVNLRWGDPSYLIEYGEPGWVYDPNSLSQPPPPTQTKSRRKKNMPKSDYLKRRDEEFSAQLTLFKNNIGDYVTTYGLTTGQVTGQANDADYFAYILAVQDVCATCAQEHTAWKELIRFGGEPGTPPADAEFPTAVAPVAPGIEKRFRDLVKQMKNHPAHNTAAAEALGIEGPVQTGPDFSVLKPVLRLELNGGLVVVRWGWEGYGEFLDMAEIQVDRGSGWQMLAYDTTPNYTDTTALPATAAVWKYRAIYRVGDARVGQWSDVVSITVAA